MRVCKETRRLDAIQRYIKIKTPRWWSWAEPVCEKCRDRVVGEKMWRCRVFGYPYAGGWACFDCARTLEEAYDILSGSALEWTFNLEAE